MLAKSKHPTVKIHVDFNYGPVWISLFDLIHSHKHL